MAAEASVSPGKYAGLAGDVRGHCSWFLTRTNKEHQATMEHPFMKTIYAKSFDLTAYAQYLSGQYLVFRELERLCALGSSEVPLKAVHDEQLHRGDALARDLRFWAGAAWEDKAAAPSPSTARYLERLHQDASDPWLLLCHHFLQYNAVLSGGQFLGRNVSERAHSEGLAAAGASAADSGAAFYEFAPECQPTHARVQRYIDDLDALTIPPELRDRMLQCMRDVYILLLAMFDEGYNAAPIAGISYEASKSFADGASPSAGGKKRKGPPPPPSAPASRKFTLKELHEHSEGKQLLTAVLGRVYDVSVARDLFGKKGPYEMFTGHDGTFNLAVMSMKTNTLDKFDYELEDEDKACLADWIAYFDSRYGCPLGTLRDRRHGITLKDLPRATKIPFEELDEDDEDTPPSGGQPPASKL